MLNNLFGVISLSNQLNPSKLNEIFYENFSFLLSNEKIIHSDNIIFHAPKVIKNSVGFIAYREIPILWNTESNEYIKVNDNHFIDENNLLGFYKNKVINVSNQPILISIKKEKNFKIYSSTVGSRTIYYLRNSQYLVFADHVGLLRKLRYSGVSTDGLSEIIRFGANYHEKTILKDLNKVPFSNYCEISKNNLSNIAYNYFGNKSQTLTDKKSITENTENNLDKTLKLLSESNEKLNLMFSGGVDSIIIAKKLKDIGADFESYFYSMGDDDPERNWVNFAASELKMNVNIIDSNLDLNLVDESIQSYSTPTLDFSTVSTYDLGKSIPQMSSPSYLIDGTGGDAWYGFDSMRLIPIWKNLFFLNSALQRISSKVYTNLLNNENNLVSRIIKSLARLPNLPFSALGHLTVNPIYKEIINYENWNERERVVIDNLNKLSNGKKIDQLNNFILADATMIAVDCFAAKSGNWHLVNKFNTVYPFLMPNITRDASQFHHSVLKEKNEYKPILKSILINHGINHELVYRKKSGFQPPLKNIFSKKDAVEKLIDVFERKDEVDPFLTNFAKQMPKNLLIKKNNLKITSLYTMWGIYSIKEWIRNIRNNDLKY